MPIGLGFVFWDCDFVSDGCPAGTVFLGRPWRPTGKTAVLDCRLGAHIAPEGFSPWQSRTDSDLACFVEAGSTGEGAAAARCMGEAAGQPAGRRAAQMCTEALQAGIKAESIK
ncbi:pectinesterase family protein [Faecalibacterium sp.]|uniref:pectinesterase family protein n=1 Tax=Faecalibacterium sp. TaxID=1971605 RepID=UPI003529B1D3